jgi:hypothetical protein
MSTVGAATVVIPHRYLRYDRDAGKLQTMVDAPELPWWP